MRLLWIDNTQETLCPELTSQIVYASSADAAVALLSHDSFDLVVVNTACLSGEGLNCIKRLRLAAHAMPLVALTTPGAMEKIRALGCGADDAISWPLHMDELRGFLMAVYKRSCPAPSELECGNISLCPSSQDVRVDAVWLRLTGMEYRVLEILTLNKEACIRKNMILAHLYKSMDDEPDGRVVDVFVCKLRRKLERAGANWMISTVWGEGYTLQPASRAYEVTKPQRFPDNIDLTLTDAAPGLWLQ